MVRNQCWITLGVRLEHLAVDEQTNLVASREQSARRFRVGEILTSGDICVVHNVGVTCFAEPICHAVRHCYAS